jgi:teichuronic acid biosynthesis glycosyltransferase TuaG
MPKFSVIIPTHNRSKALCRCLDSLMKQTYTNFEVIVCDDGSTDNTREIVELYKDKLFISYDYSENWGGPAKPRNKGIDLANGEWLCFLDSDDWYTNNRMEYLSKIDLNNYDLVYHDLTIVKNGLVEKNTKSRQLKPDAFHDLLFNLNAIPTSSTCVRTSRVREAGGFSLNKEIIGLEDFDLWIKMAKRGIRTKYIPLALGYYAIGNDNITFKDERQINRFKIFYNLHINTLTSKDEKEKTEGALNYQIATVYLLENDTKNAIAYLINSFHLGSFVLKLKSVYILFRGIYNKCRSRL